MNEDFYMKFPSVLRDALLSGKISLPDNLEVEFNSFTAYRGIFRNDNIPFIPLERKDFDSQAEKALRTGNARKNRRRAVDDIGLYSCSVYTDISDIQVALKIPQYDRCIAKGTVSGKNGCIRRSFDTSHVDWWLYEKTSDFWNDFELVS